MDKAHRNFDGFALGKNFINPEEQREIRAIIDRDIQSTVDLDPEEARDIKSFISQAYGDMNPESAGRASTVARIFRRLYQLNVTENPTLAEQCSLVAADVAALIGVSAADYDYVQWDDMEPLSEELVVEPGEEARCWIERTLR